jgi:hypothetical protein
MPNHLGLRLAAVPFAASPPSIQRLIGAERQKWLTLEFLIQLSTRSHAQGAYKLFEIDSAVPVVVKYVEDILSKLLRVSKWEKLLVDLAEFAPIEVAAWAIP